MRYTYRLRPGRSAAAALLAEWGRCRWLWNEAVHQQKSGQKPTFVRLGKLLTEARARLPWLRAGSQVAQQQMLRDYAKALDRSFKVTRCGRPKVKSRKTSLPSLEYTARGFSIRDGRLVLPKGVTIPVVWSRELPSLPTSVRVYRDSLGHWYASFVIRREVEFHPPGQGSIGIDWGVSTTATTTDPRFDLPYLGHRKRCAAELAKAQRKMARRRRKGGPQSRGYREAQRQTARLARKATRQTVHDSQVWATRLVRTHDLIAVEDFEPAFLAKSTMARKAADAAIGAAKRVLIERATRGGRTVVLVRPAYTTMTCSSCFARAKRLELHERDFRCEVCGFADSRDRNAARVILAVAERGHVGVEDVRQSAHLLRGRGSVAV
ncbi:RNA-guided endonuclease InsQ/TnpB family protein [Nocardia macrotermitis]|uniref:RNA-guided endonuclease InsQ/TnpB family protein n=1 Tax=Nocardia macrotermitis TaxID=2585198 RepID=UPI0029E7D4B1|nr:transposase [Nocardia macrotermitis]